jgi:hypothetical protein
MKLQIEITREDFLNFNVDHFLKTQLKKTILFAVLGLLVLQIAIHRDKVSLDLTAIAVSTVMFSSIYFLILYFQLQRSKRMPTDDGSILGWKTLDFSEEGLSYSDRASNGIYRWDAIKSIVKTKNAVYLYIDAHMAIMIPSRFIATENLKNEFQSILDTYIGSK